MTKIKKDVIGLISYWIQELTKKKNWLVSIGQLVNKNNLCNLHFIDFNIKFKLFLEIGVFSPSHQMLIIYYLV